MTMRLGHLSRGSMRVNRRGFVLIAVLSISAVITALAVGFIYTVQTNTSLLSSFSDSAKAYSMAKSGVLAGIAAWREGKDGEGHDGRFPEEFVIKNPYLLEQDLVVKIEDESGKFNLNSLVFPSGAKNAEAVADFKRLLKYLSLSENIAEKTVAWIRREHIDQGGKDSVDKIFRIESADEILLMPGMSREEFILLGSYVTVYGDALVNVNTADLPVLMSLSSRITEDTAQRIRSFRLSSPFMRTSDVMKVPGFNSLGVDLMGKISVTSSFLKFDIVVSYKDIKKEVQVIVKKSHDQLVVESWREM